MAILISPNLAEYQALSLSFLLPLLSPINVMEELSFETHVSHEQPGIVYFSIASEDLKSTLIPKQ